MAHEQSRLCMKALTDQREITLQRDTVRYGKTVYEGKLLPCMIWFYHSTPICKVAIEHGKWIIQLNHHGWYTLSTNRRFNEITRNWNVSLPKQWNGEYTIVL